MTATAAMLEVTLPNRSDWSGQSSVEKRMVEIAFIVGWLPLLDGERHFDDELTDVIVHAELSVPGAPWSHLPIDAEASCVRPFHRVTLLPL